MKNLSRILFIFCLTCATSAFSQVKQPATQKSEVDKFYSFLGSEIKYPVKARTANEQGNSIVLFTVNGGILKTFTVVDANAALGFDEEVVENLFRYKDFQSMGDGKYALVSAYRMYDSKSPIRNEVYNIPKGYTELKINIVAYAPEKAGIGKQDLTGKIETGPLQIIGYNRINNDKKPIIILNDEQVTVALNTIDPETIKSVTLLKDASALKYGDQGKNGVIIITTKDYLPKKASN